MEITVIFTTFVLIFTSMILAFLYYLYFFGFNNGNLSLKRLVTSIVVTALIGILVAGGLISSVTYFIG